jgi:hypothetical protein
MNAQRLINLLTKANLELEACEEVLNDGIDYGQDFYNELNEHINTVVKTASRVKDILVKRYGVVAI